MNLRSDSPATISSMPCRKRGWKWFVLTTLAWLIGFALFYWSQGWLFHVDHSQDATIGPIRYYGFPLPCRKIDEASTVMSVFATIKWLRVIFNLVFWIYVVQMSLRTGNIIAWAKVNRRAFMHKVLFTFAVIGIVMTLLYLTRDYFLFSQFWEYSRIYTIDKYNWWLDAFSKI